MRRAAPLAGLIGGLIAAALLAACQTTGDTPLETPPDTATQAEPAEPPPALETTALPIPALPTPAPPPPVPHIYMALQSGDAGRPVSAVFAIDAARDNTPSDDPAIRLTPDNELCNPQEMRSYDFSPQDAARPVASEAEQAQGLTAGGLPDFMAVIVTERMLERGLASNRAQTRALNICTRMLWERLLLAENQPAPVRQ
jgi:hypothetical protein